MIKKNTIIPLCNKTLPTQKSLVLIVDDQAIIRLLSRKYLQDCDFNIIEAESAEQGLEICLTQSPDVILLDVNMPSMDGYEACKQLRSQIRFQTTPIVMMTGYDDVPSIEKAFEAGATDFVTKPVNWLILSHRLRYMIRAGSLLNQLHDSQMRLGAAQRIAHIGNWEYDIDEHRMYWSDEVYRILGLSNAEIYPSFDELYYFIPQDQLAKVKTQIATVISSAQTKTLEHNIILQNQSVHIVQQQLQIRQDQKTGHRVLAATIQDITDQRRSEEKIRYMAHFDELTGLANRGYFKQLLQKNLTQAQHNREFLAVIFLDIDRFKQVNDSLGHEAGDKLLQAIAQRLQDSIRHADVIGRNDESDQPQVARFGGDEFTILLDKLRTPVDAAKTAKRILQVFSQPIKVYGHDLVVSPSIGISVYPNDATSSEGLLKNADLAMYYAKNRGRNNYVFYSEPMNTQALERFHLESSLKQAINKNELLAYFQPKVTMADRKLHGFETLVRWNHPDLGLVLPQNFIALAEETGFINQIGETMLLQTCQKIRAWVDKGYVLKKYAINLSPRQFIDNSIVELIQRVLAQFRLPGDYLEIEVTENIFMENTREIITIMKKIKSLGVSIALDDFGTGFSSLNYLKRFPIDALKIDKTFLKGIEQDNDNNTITQTIIAMARCLHLQVIAEGVETEAQFARLQALGCDIAQGYLFSRPLSAADAEQYLQQAFQPA